MANISSDKRAVMEKKVLTVMDILDDTGANSKRYKAFFEGMDDTAFNKWFKEFSESTEHFQLEVVPFKNEPTLDDIRKSAKFLKLDLFQHVYYPSEASSTGTIPLSHKPVPVGYIHIKRLQQILSHKTSFTDNTSQRNQITGQVTRDAKVARTSDYETSALTVMGADETLKELMGPRADNRSRKLAMNELIAIHGEVSNEELDVYNDITDNVALNSIDIFLTGAGMMSDLVTDSLLLTGTFVERGETRRNPTPSS